MPFSWQNLPKPIFGLAPMDGITDSVFRSVMFDIAPPDVLFTEFVSVEGLSRRIPALFNDLKFQNHERPMIAQIYGYDLSAFKISAKIVAELGFDGLDINMGCPAKSVVHSGGGAALIKTCPHAKQIIKTCADVLEEHYQETGIRIPLSVKTRLGYEKQAIQDWIGSLLECKELTNLSLHGRTLKQGYSGEADWEAIAQAAEMAQGSGINILGNGDLKDLEDAYHKALNANTDGVLLGRASYGNPWLFFNKEKARKGIFDPHSPSVQQKAKALLKHASLLWKEKDPKNFIQIRKHCGWYMKGFEGAAELRQKLLQVTSLEQLQLLLEPFTA